MKNTTIDPDNPPLTDDFFDSARVGIDHLPGPMQEALRNMRRTRGPQKTPTKQLVSLRLSRDVLDAYRSTGRGWQARIDETLQRAAARLKTASSMRRPMRTAATSRRRAARKAR